MEMVGNMEGLDTFICGLCAQYFHDIDQFVEHKNSEQCFVSRQPLATDLEQAQLYTTSDTVEQSTRGLSMVERIEQIEDSGARESIELLPLGSEMNAQHTQLIQVCIDGSEIQGLAQIDPITGNYYMVQQFISEVHDVSEVQGVSEGQGVSEVHVEEMLSHSDNLLSADSEGGVLCDVTDRGRVSCEGGVSKEMIDKQAVGDRLLDKPQLLTFKKSTKCRDIELVPIALDDVNDLAHCDQLKIVVKSLNSNTGSMSSRSCGSLPSRSSDSVTAAENYSEEYNVKPARRRGRPRIGEAKSSRSLVNQVKVTEQQRRQMELGPAGRLVCRLCGKSFTRQRHFNSHKCFGEGDFVDPNIISIKREVASTLDEVDSEEYREVMSVELELDQPWSDTVMRNEEQDQHRSEKMQNIEATVNNSNRRIDEVIASVNNNNLSSTSPTSSLLTMSPSSSSLLNDLRHRYGNATSRKLLVIGRIHDNLSEVGGVTDKVGGVVGEVGTVKSETALTDSDIEVDGGRVLDNEEIVIRLERVRECVREEREALERLRHCTSQWLANDRGESIVGNSAANLKRNIAKCYSEHLLDLNDQTIVSNVVSQVKSWPILAADSIVNSSSFHSTIVHSAGMHLSSSKATEVLTASQAAVTSDGLKAVALKSPQANNLTTTTKALNAAISVNKPVKILACSKKAAGVSDISAATGNTSTITTDSIKYPAVVAKHLGEFGAKSRGEERKDAGTRLEDINRGGGGGRKAKEGGGGRAGLDRGRGGVSDIAEFDRCLDVDLSPLVDQLFTLHVIEQNENENAVGVKIGSSVKVRSGAKVKGLADGRGSRKARPLSIYTCDVCGKVFMSLSHIRLHCVIHTDAKPFRCHRCSFASNTKGNLYTHMRKHTGSMYRCSVCTFKTANRTHLVEHEQTHSSIRHMCEMCKRSYNTLKSLRNHVTTHHTDHIGLEYLHMIKGPSTRRAQAIIHQCRVCHRKFKNQDKRDQHLLIHERVKAKSLITTATAPLATNVSLEDNNTIQYKTSFTAASSSHDDIRDVSHAVDYIVTSAPSIRDVPDMSRAAEANICHSASTDSATEAVVTGAVQASISGTLTLVSSSYDDMRDKYSYIDISANVLSVMDSAFPLVPIGSSYDSQSVVLHEDGVEPDQNHTHSPALNSMRAECYHRDLLVSGNQVTPPAQVMELD